MHQMPIRFKKSFDVDDVRWLEFTPSQRGLCVLVYAFSGRTDNGVDRNAHHLIEEVLLNQDLTPADMRIVVAIARGDIQGRHACEDLWSIFWEKFIKPPRGTNWAWFVKWFPNAARFYARTVSGESTAVQQRDGLLRTE